MQISGESGSVFDATQQPAGANVFAELGFAPEEAAKLKADSQRLISVKLALQNYLVAELAAWIEINDLMPADIAQILGITRQRVSDVIEKNGAGFSIDSLVSMLARAGKRVTICVT
ncbi:helix-turn-helix domain-containing protein [Herbaspirillum robiniae]|uniref:XRE family transcriptional regulator n=1 Tax=Herbaspirillum robiniae TaxID=2014887 RepID=A0ABX2M8U7_9BURK|nr:XRE family transcriptional regulator [Herbaspirillum robiniae]NUU04677.1 XRE family transcriptional regulator [Herbaspirillum robiniae]